MAAAEAVAGLQRRLWQGCSGVCGRAAAEAAAGQQRSLWQGCSGGCGRVTGVDGLYQHLISTHLDLQATSTLTLTAAVTGVKAWKGGGGGGGAWHHC